MASTGPRPMISGSRALTPEEMTRAIGVMPSSRARVSLITMTAAAPSLSGQALPAVTVPSGRKTGFSSASFSLVVPARMPSSRVTVTGLPSASTVSIGMISRSKKPRSWAAVARCCDMGGELVLVLTGDVLVLGHVLGGLAHAEVVVGDAAVEGRPGRGAALGALGGAGLGGGHALVVGAGQAVGHARAELADGLDAGGDEDVALAGLDGVGGHADRLQRRRAVAVHGDAGDVAHAGQVADDAGDVVALHARGLGACRG